MADKLAALRHLLAASRYGATDHRAKIALDFLDPRAVAGWVYWKLSQRQLGEIEPGSIHRIQVLPEEKSLLITGEAAALDRLQVLIESLDTPNAPSISVSCLSVETAEPYRLLCQPRVPTIIEMPDGTEFDPATTELDVGRLCPVAPDYADRCVLVVNPYVDPGELERMIEEEAAEMPWEPRLVEREGLGGVVTFQCEHTTPSGQPGLRLAALVGRHSLITVQVTLRCDGQDDGSNSGTVQYVALPGQTVAVGVIPRRRRRAKTAVLLVTVDILDRGSRRVALRRAREHAQRLQKMQIGRR